MILSWCGSVFHTVLCSSVKCAIVCVGCLVFEYLFVFGEKMCPFEYLVACV